jgi:hypothetical protein
MCKRVKNSCTVLMPECYTKRSNLTCSVWQNMHLQGLASADALVVASVPHLLNKQKQVIDFSRHPLLLSLQKQQLANDEQLQSTKLLAILVITDVEHRIITPSTQRLTEQKWKLACQKSEDTLHSLCSLFDPSLRSLITSPIDATSCPEISFITDAANRPLVTGYDNAVLSQVYSEHFESTLLWQLSSLAI